MSKSLTYRDAGVDIKKGSQAVERIKAIAETTHRPEVMGGIGSFAGAFHWADSGTLLAGADGVGSKLLVAQAVGRHDTVGIDLVAMNVNDVLANGGEPLFFLDYIAVGYLDPSLIAELVEGIGEGCRQAGCALLGGETAEMPALYGRGVYDLAGFVVGRQIKQWPSPVPGDRILGVASSGFHSNGYALIHRIIADHDLAWGQVYPACQQKTLGDCLLMPTRIYVDPIRRLWDRYLVRGLAHITGGGILENLPRTLAPGQGAKIKRGTWPIPELFSWFAALGNVAETEMFRTFNMGIGFMVVVEVSEAAAALDFLHQAGLEAFDVGEVVEQPGVVLV